MSTRKDSFDLIREKQELDAFLSDITDKKTSDLIREKRDLDIFLSALMEDGLSPEAAEAMIKREIDPRDSVSADQEKLTMKGQELSRTTGTLFQQEIKDTVTSAAPEPMSELYDRKENAFLQQASQDITEESPLSIDTEKSVMSDAVISNASVIPEESTASDDETRQKIEVEISDEPPEMEKSDDSHLEVVPDPVSSEPSLLFVEAEESSPANIPKEEEKHPDVSDHLPSGVPSLVLEELELVPAEIHQEEERHLEAVPDHTTSESTPLVMEKRELDQDDFQQEDEKHKIEPEKAEAAMIFEDRHPADSKEIQRDELSEEALPSPFIVKREERVESRQDPSEIDKTVELPKAFAAAEEPESVKFLPESEDKEITREEMVFGKSSKARPDKQRQRSWIRAGILVAVFAAMLQGYFWLYPNMGQQMIRWMASNIPHFDQLVEVDRKHEITVSEQIKFVDVKQRFVYNIPMGRDIRVVEGIAINQAAFPVSTIKILGELYDAHGSILASKVTFCGNILSEEKLAVLGEEEIRSALSIPQGSDLSNNKILPQSQIPFMIIFTREPAGVVKTTIMPIGATGVSP